MSWLDCEAVGRRLYEIKFMDCRDEFEATLLAQHCEAKSVSLLELRAEFDLVEGVLIPRGAKDAVSEVAASVRHPKAVAEVSATVAEDVSSSAAAVVAASVPADDFAVLDSPVVDVLRNAKGEPLATAEQRAALLKLAAELKMSADDVAAQAMRKFQIARFEDITAKDCQMSIEGTRVRLQKLSKSAPAV